VRQGSVNHDGAAPLGSAHQENKGEHDKKHDRENEKDVVIGEHGRLLLDHPKNSSVSLAGGADRVQALGNE